MSTTPESSVRVSASPTINYSLLMAIIGAICSGAWFMATQTAQGAASAERAGRIEGRVDAVEHREEEQTKALGAIDSRLARIEAQLSLLTAGRGR